MSCPCWGQCQPCPRACLWQGWDAQVPLVTEAAGERPRPPAGSNPPLEGNRFSRTFPALHPHAEPGGGDADGGRAGPWGRNLMSRPWRAKPRVCCLSGRETSAAQAGLGSSRLELVFYF